MENENQNNEAELQSSELQSSSVSEQPIPTQEQPSSAPQQYQRTVKLPNEPVRHMSLGVASVVLGGVSMLCCWMYGLGIIPAVIGAILGLIALIRGEGKARILGGIGLGLSIVGLVLGIIMILTYASMINWSNVTIENIMTLEDIDPNNNDEVTRWLQQFFNVDISGYVR